MLQAVDIKKEYRTGSLVQKALDGVSLNFRDSEFVAILGPSGSGKTTLLNIIGGLDRYDSGDLIINNVSTKQYKDKDWDSYRNHTIGFVFQSYNLIPHQSILANVELALTISGISGKERRERAKNALEKVGLGDQIHKLPSQMSGGQMQRVAIARALVNDPDILLADEPTGALDSDTSVQIMDLLKEVASDRLVIMVTHNPELAHTYATRIVELKDGQILSDSDPYIIDGTEAAAPIHKNMGKSSMSFLTALHLSLTNLLTKKARTILVAFAGSIGIIGIALILAMSNGATRYINSIEEDTLSEYPMEITSTSFSLASVMASMSSTGEEEDEDTVKEIKTITRLLSTMSSNDLASLKTYIDSGESGIDEQAKHIRYSYDVTPLVYQKDGTSYTQVNPYSVLSSFDNGMSSFYSGMSTFSMSMTNLFHEMPDNENLYIDQYEIKAGRWPENYNEVVLVLTVNNNVSDLALYAMGLLDDSALEDAVKEYMNGGELSMEDDTESATFEYDDFLGITFRLVNACDCYQYDSQYDVWTSKVDNKAFMKKLVGSSEELTIVGVVKPAEDARSAMLSTGINYPYELTEHTIEVAAESDIVKAQLASPDKDILTGEPFGEKPENALDLTSMFSIDEEKIKDAFSMDTDSFADSLPEMSMDGFNVDLSGLTDLSSIAGALPDMSGIDLSSLLGSININITEEDINNTATKLAESYQQYAAEHPEADISKLGDSVYDFLGSEAARNVITNDLRSALEGKDLELVTNEDLQGLIGQVVAGFEPWAAEHEATDAANYSEYLNEYLNSEEVLTILRNFMDSTLQRAAQVSLEQEDIEKIMQDLLAAYNDYSVANGNPTVSDIAAALMTYLASDESRQIITETLLSKIDTSDLERQLSEQIQNLTAELTDSLGNIVASLIAGAMEQAAYQIQDMITSYMGTVMGSLSEQLENAFSFDADTFADAIKMNVDENELNDLLTSMLSNNTSTYDQNLKTFGYADTAKPSEILIYPKNFESKDIITAILDDYNVRMKDSGQEDKVITYTDMVGTMMSSVTIIVNAISYILIAFVSISLVVSSIMIGVITYISVLERRKEIGILRSIGASKRNISSVFNAETIITGLLAGIFGVGISLLLLIPVNALLRFLTGQSNLGAYIPAGSAILLIVLSVVLTLIGGLIPSKKAANSDPVAALREV